MNDNLTLSGLNRELRIFLLLFIIVLTAGITVGIIYLGSTVEMKLGGIEEHYKGSLVSDEFDIPEKYPRSTKDLLLTTHNHLLSLSLVFLAIGGIFSINSHISGKLKWFLMYEPFISILFTFGGIWGLRFLHSGFLWLVVLSGFLMYACYYVMAGICMRELVTSRK